MASDLAETIAWVRAAVQMATAGGYSICADFDNETLTRLLDAAEAGARARDAALEEAAQIVDNMVHPANKASPSYAVCLGAARRIRALKGAA